MNLREEEFINESSDEDDKDDGVTEKELAVGVGK